MTKSHMTIWPRCYATAPSAVPHKFQIGQKVWLSDTTALGKNQKLTPKWIGPYKIVNINDNNPKIELLKNKFKVCH
jgi:hypothetical protein